MDKMYKTCTQCKKDKVSDEFYKDHVRKDGKNGDKNWCKNCQKKYAISHYESVGRNRKLVKKYGITVEKYDDIYIGQGGSCAICGTHQSKLTCRLAVDHDHETSAIRGLLCRRCNSGVGLFEDDINLLKNVIRYLE